MSTMSSPALIGIIILALGIVAVIASYVAARRAQTESSQAQSGIAYDRLARRATSSRATQSRLLRRRQRGERTQELRRAIVYRETFKDLLPPNETTSDRSASRAVEREVPPPIERARRTSGERVQRPSIHPPRSDRKA